MAEDDEGDSGKKNPCFPFIPNILRRLLSVVSYVCFSFFLSVVPEPQLTPAETSTTLNNANLRTLWRDAEQQIFWGLV